MVGFLKVCSLLTFVSCFCVTAQASTFKVLYTFTNGVDGGGPASGLIQDEAGNLYGTTQLGGVLGGGTVFRVAPDGNETVLYSFKGGNDGSWPASQLVMDGLGNLFGTTLFGGGDCNCGTVFRLAPDGTETVLHSFARPEGGNPYGGVISDIAGNLYGTTSFWGEGCTCGTVFKLSPDGVLTLLHTFTGDKKDGAFPRRDDLAMDQAGNLYGTTEKGGFSGHGTVFTVSAGGTYGVLDAFRLRVNGHKPMAGVIADAEGNLYGTTERGGFGKCRCGTVFKLSADGKRTILHSFEHPGDGSEPQGRLVADAAGNLYGTTWKGGRGPNCACGTVFKIAPNGMHTVLYSFNGESDGGNPNGDLIMDKEGNLYGTGARHDGSVFEITP